MAKLKIGSGIKLETQVPKVEQADYQVVPVAQAQQGINQLSIEDVQALINSIPKPEIPVQQPVDLSDLATKNELNIAVIELCKQRDELEIKVEELQKQVNQIEDKPVQPPIVVPEVKQITHVTDVSQDVRNEVQVIVRHIDKLQSKVDSQKKINLVLGSVLIITIFLHLI